MIKDVSTWTAVFLFWRCRCFCFDVGTNVMFLSAQINFALFLFSQNTLSSVPRSKKKGEQNRSVVPFIALNFSQMKTAALLSSCEWIWKWIFPNWSILSCWPWLVMTGRFHRICGTYLVCSCCTSQMSSGANANHDSCASTAVSTDFALLCRIGWFHRIVNDWSIHRMGYVSLFVHIAQVKRHKY